MNKNATVDSYFRIDNSRITINYYLFIENKVKGTIQYINSFVKVLEEKNQYNDLKLLKGTFLKLFQIYFMHIE